MKYEVGGVIGAHSGGNYYRVAIVEGNNFMLNSRESTLEKARKRIADNSYCVSNGSQWYTAQSVKSFQGTYYPPERKVNSMYEWVWKDFNFSTAYHEGFNINYTSAKPKKTIMNKVSEMFKKLLDAPTQVLVEAGYLDNNLELTSEGGDALDAVLFTANKDALVASAQAKLDAAKK